METICTILQLADTDASRAVTEMETLFEQGGGFVAMLESIDHENKKVDKVLFSCYYNLGYLYQRAGHHDKAIDVFTCCMNLFSKYNDDLIWYAMGISFYQLKRYEEAGPCFLHFLKTDPDEKEHVQQFLKECVSHVRAAKAKVV